MKYSRLGLRAQGVIICCLLGSTACTSTPSFAPEEVLWSKYDIALLGANDDGMAMYELYGWFRGGRIYESPRALRRDVYAACLNSMPSLLAEEVDIPSDLEEGDYIRVVGNLSDICVRPGDTCPGGPLSTSLPRNTCMQSFVVYVYEVEIVDP